MDTLQETTRRQLEFDDEDEDEGSTDLSVDNITIESLHSKISKEIIPRVGMEFETEDAAYEFYNAYAFAIGFSVRKSSGHRYKGIQVDKKFVCSCQCQREVDKRDNVYKSHRAETRFGCLAMLRISFRQTGKYCIAKFDAEHNHNLASPSKSHLFRSHRKVSKSQALEVDLADISGIAPKNAYEFMARQAGGRENLGFSQVDYRNYLRSKRTLKVMSGDTGGVLEYLQGMKVDDPNFFYAIQVDEDDLITNIFWADGKMMVDYDIFGDVVCFDTTYRKHKDGRPIALFVGVNHHKQTIIFGAALLYDETAESFVWLFDTFSRAMGGKLPMTMLTDQDAAMSKALAYQWPGTKHRLCVWHIFQNAAVHLGGVFSKYKDFSRDFSNCVYDYEYEDDFLDAWSKMLDKYELQSNDWLNRLFNIREKWALVYGRDTFCADMTTTQRSESMNKHIKHYVSYKHDMRRFFENFQRLLNDRRYDEMVADFKASQTQVSLSFPVAILKHVASIFTPKVFLLFQQELYRSYDYLLEACSETDHLFTYIVKPHEKHSGFVVTHDSRDGAICCNCRKFEFTGLLCSHILKVFSHKRIKEVPDKYVLKRWTKNAKKGSMKATSESVNVDVDPKTAMGRHYRELCRLSTRLVTRAAETERGYAIVKKGLLDLLKELDSSSIDQPLSSSSQNLHVVEGDQNHDMPSNVDAGTARGIKVKPKSGSRSSKRPKSGLEKANNRKKRPKVNTTLDKDYPSLVSNHIDQPPTPPSHVVQANQAVQFDNYASQQASCFVCPSNPSEHNLSTLSEYGQDGMYVSTLLSQPNQQFQPSYMALLTSIGVPPPLDDDQSSRE